MNMVIFEQDAFQRAGIDLLDLSWQLIQAQDVEIRYFPESKGIARLLNLLNWEADGEEELVDGEGMFADQVIHLGIHRVLDRHLGSSAHAMLASECLASCSDLYLLGKLSLAGEESDFLVDALDSFGSYYTQYADEAVLEDLLRMLQHDPYGAMLASAQWLYSFCEQLLYPEDPVQTAHNLLPLEDHMFYPLVHHYNTTNWILTIRSKHHEPSVAHESIDTFWASLEDSENVLLDIFRQEL